MPEKHPRIAERYSDIHLAVHRNMNGSDCGQCFLSDEAAPVKAFLFRVSFSSFWNRWSAVWLGLDVLHLLRTSRVSHSGPSPTARR